MPSCLSNFGVYPRYHTSAGPSYKPNLRIGTHREISSFLSDARLIDPIPNSEAYDNFYCISEHLWFWVAFPFIS